MKKRYAMIGLISIIATLTTVGAVSAEATFTLNAVPGGNKWSFKTTDTLLLTQYSGYEVEISRCYFTALYYDGTIYKSENIDIEYIKMNKASNHVALWFDTTAIDTETASYEVDGYTFIEATTAFVDGSIGGTDFVSTDPGGFAWRRR